MRGASRRRSELEVIGIPNEMKPEIAVLRGRLAEALGHDKDALDAYRYAAQSGDREASAEARLLEALLRTGAANSTRPTSCANWRYWRSPGAATRSS